jgi:hypothetical protein
LTAFTDAAVKLEIDELKRSQPPLRGDLAWKVSISPSATGRPTGKIYFRADYQIKESDGQLVPGIIMTTLDIQERVPDTIDKVVTASLETGIENFQDQQARQVFVVVKNISNVPMTVTGIHAWSPPDITPTVENLGPGLRLEPQQSNPFMMTLTASDAIQSGKHLLVVRVDAEWDKAGQHTKGSIVLNKDFTVSVFGESAILQATTIPSVMLLPGFLLVATLIMLVRWSWKKTILDLDFKKPEFYVIAITISLVIIAFYPQITGPLLTVLYRRPMSSRNYLQSYGFNDILLLWLGAVVLGVLIWVIGSAGFWLFQWGFNHVKAFLDKREREKQMALVPFPKDSPLITLRKIANNQGGSDLQQAHYPLGDQASSVFILPSGFPEPDKVWVAPRIRLQWRKDNDSLKDELDRLLSQPRSMRELVEKLEAWVNPLDPVIDLDWERTKGLVKSPTLVYENQIKKVAQSDPFINTSV